MSSESKSPPPGEELLAVGEVKRPHGLRGAVIVEVMSDWPGRFKAGSRLLVERQPGRLEELTVEYSTPHRGRMLVEFSGIMDRDGAESMRDGMLYIRSSQASPLADGEYWAHDLVGMKVFEEDGAPLGEVSEVVTGSAQDLLCVSGAGRPDFQLPFVEEFVIEVDGESSRIVVRLIDGIVQ